MTRPREPSHQRSADEVDGGEMRVRAPLRLGWWIVSLAVVVLAAMLLHFIVTNPNLEWRVVAQYFTSRDVLLGLLRTLQLTAISMTIGLTLGVVLAVMRLSVIPVLRSTSFLYTWVFRATPLFVQILFWYNIAALLPELSLGIPFGPELLGPFDTNAVITPFAAAIIGLSLNEGAYMAEITRAGLISVDQGQTEAASALGMTRLRTLRRITIPQALRVILPPTGNQVIGMLRASALVSVTSTPELLYSVQVIYNRTFQTVPLLVVASLWYLIVTSVLIIGQHYLERRYARGAGREPPPSPVRSYRRRFDTWRHESGLVVGEGR